jgi:menaquinone-dependent protoporphyrinogen oxidase
MKVHVITSTRHGSTAEVGAAIAQRLSQRGLSASVSDAKDAAPLESGDAVVIGSPIYMGKWLKPARAIVDQLGSEASGRSIFVFSLGPVGDPPEPEGAAPEQEVEAFASERAKSSRVFAGKLDSTQLGRLERLAIKAVKAPDGDYRDWSAIETWADEIATYLIDSEKARVQAATHA